MQGGAQQTLAPHAAAPAHLAGFDLRLVLSARPCDDARGAQKLAHLLTVHAQLQSHKQHALLHATSARPLCAPCCALRPSPFELSWDGHSSFGPPLCTLLLSPSVALLRSAAMAPLSALQQEARPAGARAPGPARGLHRSQAAQVGPVRARSVWAASCSPLQPAAARLHPQQLRRPGRRMSTTRRVGNTPCLQDPSRGHVPHAAGRLCALVPQGSRLHGERRAPADRARGVAVPSAE